MSNFVIVNLIPLIPEISLSIIAIIALIAGLYCQISKAIWWIVSLFILGLIIFLVSSSQNLISNGVILGGLSVDGISLWIKGIILGFALLILIFYGGMSRDKIWKHGLHEFVIILLLGVIGAMFAVSSRNFLFLYVSLELLALSSYILAAYDRESLLSSEAGVKYFVLGSLSSCIMIFGMSYIYGFSGSLSYSSIASLLSDQLYSVGLLAGIGIFLVGMLFKLSIVPFHFWTPDIYQGSPFISAAFFSSIPKIATIAVLINIVNLLLKNIMGKFDHILIMLAIASMAVGAFGALQQKSLKRLMGYSTIFNMGFVLLSISTGTSKGFSSAIIYQILYAVASIGLFATLAITIVPDAEDYQISNLRGFGMVKKLGAFSIAIFMFSLAGIPPLGGFFGKFYVISSAVSDNQYMAAIAALMLSVVAAFYYINVVKIMYFVRPAEKQIRLHEASSLSIVIFICAGFILFFPFIQNLL